MRSSLLRALAVSGAFVAILTIAPRADTTSQPLPFSQDWTEIAQISTANDWSGVAGIIGYNGSGLVSGTGRDPQTILADGSATAVNVIANSTNPNTLTTGGVAEFHLANPVVALQGSGTASAPHIVISVSTLGQSNLQISYNLRDIDGAADNAVQPVALQYRVGGTGAYTNLPAGFVGDASTGPSLATLVTAVAVNLPPAVDNQSLVQLRIITADAVGSDEWIGIDDIRVTGSSIPQPTNPSGVGSAAPATVAAGGVTLLTVAVSPGTNPDSTGLAVAANLTSIGGEAAQALFDDGSNGDATGGDGTFSVLAAIPHATPGGLKSIPVTIGDAQGRSATAAISLDVQAPAPRGVVISQVYGGGGNSGAPLTNDFIELYNTTAAPVSLAGWSVQYSSAAGASWQVTPLTGSIAANGYYLVQEGGGANGAPPPTPDVSGTIAMGATAGKVALASTTTAFTIACPKTSPPVADFVGYGAASCFEGAAPAGALSNSTAALRNGDGAQDTDDNAADFVVGQPNPRSHLGNPPSGTGTAVPQSLPADALTSTLLTVRVTPGTHPASTDLAVTADLTPIGGSAGTALFDDGTHGDGTAHDLVFTLQTTVSTVIPPGPLSIPVTISDSVPRSSTGTIRLAVETTPTAIHDIQGSGLISPLDGHLVTTTGIVTALKFNGVFVQARDADADADPQTSEGVFVFTGATPAALLAVGQEVMVTATVQEFVPAADPASPPVTELIDAFFRVVSPGQALPAPATLFPGFTTAAGDFEQLERFEGMRIRADIQAVAPTQASFVDEVNARSVSNGIFYAVIQGVARPMREPGIEPTQPLPPGAPPTVPRFDGNPERLRVDSDALAGASRIEIAAGQTIAGLTGVLDYAFRTAMILPDPVDDHGLPWQPAGHDAAVPVPAASATEFTVGHFNLERLFDDVDDPDFSASNEPVLTPAALNDRLAKASLAIRHVLRAPDVLGTVEVENLEVLQRLAARISADALAAGEPDPMYDAYLEPGNDVGSIDVGFLVKRAGNRVAVLAVAQVGKDAVYTLPGGGTALLNDRPSLVLEARIAGPANIVYPVTVIVNHLRSLSGIDGVDGDRIRVKRRAQAEFLASYIQSRQAANPSERIVSVGDYNAFQVNDGYVDLMHTIQGVPAAADLVVLASPDLVDPNLANLVELLPPAQQYSFSFDGNAQVIDHVLVNEPMRRRFNRLAFARLDADFPESLRNDPGRPERLSDHDAPVAYFSFPGTPSISLNGAADMTIEYGAPFVDPGAAASDDGQPLPVSVSFDPVSGVDSGTLGDYRITYTATNGFFSASVTRTIHVVDTTRPAITLLGGATVTIEAGTGFVDPGATATDERAGDLTSQIAVTGSVNPNLPGIYTLTYSVSDGFNSAAATRTVRVVDTTGPAISAITTSQAFVRILGLRLTDVIVRYSAADPSGPAVCSLAIAPVAPPRRDPIAWLVLGAHDALFSWLGDETNRQYDATISCTDRAGNRSSAVTRVTLRTR